MVFCIAISTPAMGRLSRHLNRWSAPLMGDGLRREQDGRRTAGRAGIFHSGTLRRQCGGWDAVSRQTANLELLIGCIGKTSHSRQTSCRSFHALGFARSREQHLSATSGDCGSQKTGIKMQMVKMAPSKTIKSIRQLLQTSKSTRQLPHLTTTKWPSPCPRPRRSRKS